MNSFFKQLNKEAKRIKLSSHEREVMWLALENVMRPEFAVSRPARVYTDYIFFSHRLVSSMAFVLVLAMAGSGTAFAAESAVPGDALYGVKVNINEKVIEMLASSPKTKAEAQVSFAERRMKEAETLTARGMLTPDAKGELQARLEKHAALVDDEVKAIEQEDPVSAAEVSVRLGSSLSAHGALLDRLGEASDDSVSREESSRFSDALKKQVQRLALSQRRTSLAMSDIRESAPVQPSAASAKRAFNAEVAPGSDSGDFIAARIEESASSTLWEAEARFGEFEKDISSSTAKRIKKQIEKMRERINNLRGRGEEESEKAHKAAETLKVFIEAQEEYGEKMLPPPTYITDEENADDKDDDSSKADKSDDKEEDKE